MDLSPPDRDRGGPRPFTDAMVDFAAEVGESDRVAVVGGRTAWNVGGAVADDVRLVRAPAGIVDLDEAEMTVRVGAATTVADLAASLAAHDQEVALPRRPGGTVGGAVVVGHSDVRRRGRGPLRDALLEASVVTASGRLVRCGGPTVKNVSGYDLCRLLVGSLGTLALVGEVVLRTRPRPSAQRWFSGKLPSLARLAAGEPSAHLWDGTTSWLLFEGHPDDIDRTATSLAALGVEAIDEPPALPPHRWAIDPARLGDPSAMPNGAFVAEVGVGTVHADQAPPARQVPSGVRSLNQRMKQTFDPTGRLNPGRDVLLS